MKILITNSTCIQDTYGGAQRAVNEIAYYFSKKGYDVSVLVPDRLSKGSSIEIINDNYRIIRYTYFSGFLKPLNIFTAISKYYKYFQGVNFDIIWGNSPEPWIFIPKNAKKIIYTVHGPWILESKLNNNLTYIKKILVKYLYKKIVNKNSIIHFESNYTYKQCSKETLVFENSNIIISPVLLDEKLLKTPKYSEFEKYIKISNLNILIPRRLVNRTGVLEFLRNCETFPEEVKKKLNIIIVGSGYLENEIKIQSKKLFFVNFLGAINQNNLDYLYKACDVCCIPSKDAEGFGVSLLEALFRRTPVIYTRTGGLGEFLNSFLSDFGYQFNNASDLLSVIKMCLNLKENNKLNFDIKKIPYQFKKNIELIINK
jgi:glycosyltransferase involved in cell wall biosynthesis